MSHKNRLLKSLFALGLVAGFATAQPAIAGQADIDLLKSYVGKWKGRGTTTAAGETETVVCKLDIKNADIGKVNYAGRCTLAGANLAINGTMAYVNERRRFEAVMSSNTSFSGVAIGRRSGNGGIDFQLKDRAKETGEEFTIDAGIELSEGMIEIAFSVTEVASGKKIEAKVPFEQ